MTNEQMTELNNRFDKLVSVTVPYMQAPINEHAIPKAIEDMKAARAEFDALITMMAQG